jgi:peptidoglycan hydrolase-like protein with peptidoglycan-binding domain
MFLFATLLSIKILMISTFTLSTRARTSALYAALIALVVFAAAGVANADMLTRQLEQGMTGADVSTLQTFLARDTSIYPQGLVTGFFGPLTFSAVSNFQSKNGIATVGRVGPITLAAINRQMGAGGTMGTDASAPTISATTISVSTSSARVRWNTSELASGKVYYNTSPLSMTESGANDVTVTGNVALLNNDVRTTHDVTVTGLTSNTTYYYVVYSKDMWGNGQITWPQTFKTQ